MFRVAFIHVYILPNKMPFNVLSSEDLTAMFKYCSKLYAYSRWKGHRAMYRSSALQILCESTLSSLSQPSCFPSKILNGILGMFGWKPLEPMGLCGSWLLGIHIRQYLEYLSRKLHVSYTVGTAAWGRLRQAEWVRSDLRILNSRMQ